MKNSLIILGFLLGLMIFGCAAPEQPAEEQAQPAAPAEPAEEPAAPAEEPAEEPAAPAEEPAEPAEEPAEPAEEPADGLGLQGMEYTALVALGIPLECEITTTAEGQVISSKVYMKGEKEMRMEVPVEEQEVQCSKIVSIIKGEKYYTGCEGGKIFPESDCDWLEFEAEPEPGTEGEMVTQVEFGGAAVDTDYSDVPPTDIDCKPWTYDSSKFTPSGKICTMEDLMGGYEFD